MQLLTMKLMFNEPHAHCLVSIPGVIRENIPPYQRNRKVFIGIFKGEKYENIRDNIARHQKVFISSIASVHQNCVLQPRLSAPALYHPDLLSTKLIYAIRVIRGKIDKCS
jgi:hypothetical protein